MWHTAFIALHAASGAVAFVAGCVAVRRRSWFPYYFWALVGLDVFMVISVWVGWSDLATPSRVVFSALIALGGYMLWRGIQASRVRPVGEDAPGAAYLDHLGFTIIALFEGFVIVTAIDLGAPVWLTVLLAVAGVVAGNLTIRRLRARMSVGDTAAA